MATRKKAEPPKRSLGTLVDELWAAREDKRQLNEKLKVVEGGIDALTSELIERMEAEGLDRAAGKAASISVTPSTIPQIEDWETLLAFLVKSKNLHLLQRRISPDPWRELMTLRGGKPDAVPGTVPFVKKTLNLRTL